MKIRLMGLPDEVEEVISRLETVLDVVEKSAPYANRGDSRQVRCYVEIRVPQTPPSEPTVKVVRVRPELEAG